MELKKVGTYFVSFCINMIGDESESESESQESANNNNNKKPEQNATTEGEVFESSLDSSFCFLDVDI